MHKEKQPPHKGRPMKPDPACGCVGEDIDDQEEPDHTHVGAEVSKKTTHGLSLLFGFTRESSVKPVKINAQPPA